MSDFSSKEAAAPPADDPSAPKFSDLCPDEHARSEEQRAVRKEDRATKAEDRGRADDDTDDVDDHDEHEDDEVRQRPPDQAIVDLIMPLILANVREARPTAGTTSPAAETAGATPGQPAAAQTREAARTAPTATPGQGTPTAERQARGPVSDRAAQTAQAAAREAHVQGKSTATDASAPGDVAGDKASAVHALAVAARTAQKSGAEKIAAQHVGSPSSKSGEEKSEFLSADSQRVADGNAVRGTRSAMRGEPMSPANSSTPRPMSQQSANGLPDTGERVLGAVQDDVSFRWKGWTNGGGDRASTAAQFSNLGEKVSAVTAPGLPGTTPAAGRTGTVAAQPAAPAAPSTPAGATEALAPIHSAIERLVVQGREQLALTVRFEQGGSLSIKLAMRGGEIATQIQTDVPGLEAALRSSWNELSHQWNDRGWKLADPEFTGGDTPRDHRGMDTHGENREGRAFAGERGEAAPFGGRALTPARLKHSATNVAAALARAAAARRGIHTWA